MSDYQSELKLYSLGIVIEAKARDSWFIKVYPVEELPSANGLVRELYVNRDVKGVNVNGVNIGAATVSDNIIIAKWMPEGSNRATAPDVQPNETVKIYKFADTDEYFWQIHKHEPSFRRLETVRYVFGNKATGIDDFDETSSYWFEVSTHDKHIHLRTTNSDGEPFEYDIKLDTANGILKINDDIGNFIQLESHPSKLTVTTLEDIEFNTKRFVVNAEDSFTVNTKVSTINAEDSDTVNTKVREVNADESYTLNTVGSSVNASGTSDITSPVTTVSDMLMLDGAMATTGKRGTGSCKIKGDCEIEGHTETNGTTNNGDIKTDTINTGTIEAVSIHTGSINSDSHSH